MTSKKSKEDVLDGVEESRRDFIRKVIVGSVFAAPLMASFSMDGMLIGAAEAGEIPSNMTNMPYFSNMCRSPYDGPGKFKAYLTGENPHNKGVAIFRLTEDGEVLAVNLKIFSKHKHKHASRHKFISASIFVDDVFLAVPTLPKGSSVIEEEDISGELCIYGSKLDELLFLMNEGRAKIVVITKDGEISGTIVGTIV